MTTTTTTTYDEVMQRIVDGYGELFAPGPPFYVDLPALRAQNSERTAECLRRALPKLLRAWRKGFDDRCDMTQRQSVTELASKLRWIWIPAVEHVYATGQYHFYETDGDSEEIIVDALNTVFPELCL